jgi:hypothetical protein
VERRRLYIVWLGTGLKRDWRRFAQARSVARKAVRIAKNVWFQRKAVEAESGRNGGKILWRCTVPAA